MSRTARTILAGVVAAGALFAGAGAAFADDSEDGGSGSSASSSESSDSSDSEDSEGSSDEVSADELPAPAESGASDPVTGLLGSLPVVGGLL